jgi:VanZ family protein
VNARTYVPALIWAALILVATLVPITDPVGPAGTDKAAHFGLFFVQGALLAPTVASATRFLPRAMVTLALILVFAAADEMIQSYIPGRFASITDWIFDAVGAAAGLSIVVFSQLRRKKNP